VIGLRLSYDLILGLIILMVGLSFLLAGIMIGNLALDFYGGVIILFGAIDTAAWLGI
jgi:hypothetical protein